MTMKRKLTLTGNIKLFIDSLDKGSLDEQQQVLLSTTGGTDQMISTSEDLEEGDVYIHNGPKPQCKTVMNNCNGGNCVSGCGG